MIEALKTIQAESARFEDRVTENMKELDDMRQEFMSASKQIRSTLRRIGKIRESRPITPPSSLKGARSKKKRAIVRCCEIKFFGCSLQNVLLGFGLLGCFVAISLIAGLVGSKTTNSPAQSPEPMAMSERKQPWYSQNWLGGGGFEPGERTQTVGNNVIYYHLYSNFTEFPQVNNASLYFDAGTAAARLSIDANQTGLYNPARLIFRLSIIDILLNNTGFEDSSSGVLGLNISGWFNWIYAEEPLGSEFPGRTTERIYVEVNTFFPDSPGTFPDKTDLFFAPNIMTGEYRGWTRMEFFYRFEESRFPKSITFAFSSTLRGSVFFDALQSSFVPKPA
jgi:hypothetical protein